VARSVEEKRAAYRAWYRANKEKRSADFKAWREAHKAERQAYLAAYKAARPEQRRRLQATYRARHPERITALNKANYAKTREQRLAQYQEHREERNRANIERHRNNPFPHRASEKKRRAQKAQVLINDFTHEQWKTMQIVFQHCCAYCGKSAKGHLTQDHITPLSQGGNHTLSNIVPACRSCNSKKNNRAPLKPVQPLLL
jgi:5-methylcytosine-specific restriction endonuclease McrA